MGKITNRVLNQIPKYELGQVIPSYLSDIAQVLGFFLDNLPQSAPTVFTFLHPYTLNRFDWHLNYAIPEYQSNDTQRWIYVLQLFATLYSREQLGRELWKAVTCHSLVTEYAKFLIQNKLLHWRLIDNVYCDI